VGKDNIGGTCPLESSQRTQEGMDKKGLRSPSWTKRCPKSNRMD